MKELRDLKDYFLSFKRRIESNEIYEDEVNAFLSPQAMGFQLVSYTVTNIDDENG